MNKNIVGYENIRMVIDDEGNVRFFSVDNVEPSNKDCKSNEIFSLENDIEQLQDALKEREKLLKKYKRDIKLSCIVNLILLFCGFTFLNVGINDIFFTTICWIFIVYGSVDSFTVIGRIFERRKLKTNIETIKKCIKDFGLRLEKLKEKFNCQEVDININSIEIDLTPKYSYVPDCGTLSENKKDIEPSKKSEAYVLSLRKKSVEELMDKR